MSLRISNMSTKFPQKALRVPKLKNLLLATTIATGTLLGVASYDIYQYKKCPVAYDIKRSTNDLIANDIFYSHTPKEKATARLKLFVDKLGSNVFDIGIVFFLQALGLVGIHMNEKLDEKIDEFLKNSENSQ